MMSVEVLNEEVKLKDFVMAVDLDCFDTVEPDCWCIELQIVEHQRHNCGNDYADESLFHFEHEHCSYYWQKY